MKRTRDSAAPLLPLEGRVILVTGGAGGIGFASCKVFAERGATVVCADVSEQAVQQALDLLATESASGCTVDVASESSVKEMIAHVVNRHGRLDGALNAAGIEGERAPLHEATLENFQNVIDVNLRGTYLCMKYEIEQFLKQAPPVQHAAVGGSQIDARNYSIVNMSSTAGQAAMPEFSSYSASKFAIVGLTKSAAKEYASEGIRVNALCPSTTDTPMVARFTQRWPEWQAKQNASFPVGRIGRAEEVAAACAFLFSADCPMMTGTTLTVDGASSA